MKQKLLQAMVALLVGASAHAQANSGSNGSDGAFNPTTNIVINMADHPDGIYRYTSVNISNGVTVTFIPNANNTPVVWLVQSNCTVAGTVSVNGKATTNSINGAASGPGGWRGGNGAVSEGQFPESGLGQAAARLALPPIGTGAMVRMPRLVAATLSQTIIPFWVVVRPLNRYRRILLDRLPRRIH